MPAGCCAASSDASHGTASVSGRPSAGIDQSAGAMREELRSSSFSLSGSAVSGRRSDSSVGSSSCASTVVALSISSAGSVERRAATPSSDHSAIRASAGCRECR